MWLPDNAFITANNLAYLKPARIRDKRRYLQRKHLIVWYYVPDEIKYGVAGRPNDPANDPRKFTVRN